MTDQKRIKLTNTLTADQLKKLDDWIDRNPTASKGVPPGVTVKQALIDQDDWLAKQRIREAKAEEVRNRIRAERAAKQEAFARVLSVVLLSKKNKVQIDERKYVALEIAYDNKTDKAIRRVVGELRFVDIYGDTIMDINWSYDGGISAKQTVVDHGAIIFINRSLEPQLKLWNTDFEKLKSTFEVNTIIFKDGTSTKVPEGSV